MPEGEGAREPAVPFETLMGSVECWQGIDLSELKPRYHRLGPDARKCVVEFVDVEKGKGRTIEGDEAKEKEKKRLLKLFALASRFEQNWTVILKWCSRYLK